MVVTVILFGGVTRYVPHLSSRPLPRSGLSEL